MTTDSNQNQVKALAVDTEVGRVIVDRNLATAEEVAEAQAELKRLSDNNSSLGQVLVTRGIITDRQLQRIKRWVEEAGRQQIPGYQLLSKLGSGAMATVYKAKQLSLDRLVAIKVLPPRYSENSEYVERFYSEGRAAAKLNHPNIVQAIDVGEAGGVHYFAMEFVEGYTLYDELSKGKVFSEQEAVGIILQIARALDHAHERGLIHRDVKPKNIMMTTEGVAKLADMGLARLAADEQAAQAEAGRAFGTPYYISPEQIRGELNVDFRADIYSLGATLYHLVTGKVPFDAPTPAAVMHRHLKDALVPPDHINTRLSAGLGEVVEKMMSKRPEDRYASTKDLIADLELVMAGQPPLQARKAIATEALSALAKGQMEEEDDTLPLPADDFSSSRIVMYLLLGALAVSLVANILQAVLHK